MDEKDFPLPVLAPYLKLSRAPDEQGEPAFTIHNPIANAYFKIDWVSFECLSRMNEHKTAKTLKDAIEKETTLTITLDQISDIVMFLEKNGLLSLSNQKIIEKSAPRLPLWKRILHQYLYFSIPLFRPQAFLERSYKYIRWIHDPLFIKGMMIFLGLMILLTLPRMDEFLHTFSALFSPQGVISILIVFSFIKIVHEFAHAYTAIRHNVKVPHMGIAFMVLYPVLYTETTGSWALSSRRARFQIGMAGITAELCLAAIFLALWHIAPTGSMLQSLSFLVVCVSLVGSLLINLNPLMRFDGYYMLSDASGFDNLQSRSCAFARHKIREFLFGWSDAPPEILPLQSQKFLTAFGLALLIYRFFLFLGIAVLVYHIFFQPLGFLLMMVELVWFIFLPILSEVKIWWKEKDRILSSRRSLVPGAVLTVALLIVFLPWKTTISLPAVAHAGLHETIYPPSPARIDYLAVTNGDSVEEGAILATLSSPKLEFDLRAARQELNRLEKLRRRGQSTGESLKSVELSDVALEKVRLTVKALEDQKERLIIRAPFTGVVRDQGMDIIEGRYAAPTDALFTIVDPESTTVTAYATEDAREKIKEDGTAVFLSESRTRRIKGLFVQSIAETGRTSIEWDELASLYGGPIAADRDEDGAIATRRALYEISWQTGTPAPPIAQRGYVRVSSTASSIFSSWIKGLISIFRQETNAG